MSKKELLPSTASYQQMEEWIQLAQDPDCVNPEDLYFEFDPDEEQYAISWVDENGGEGQGEHRDTTIRITEKSTGLFCYVTFIGNYESWNGTEWEYKSISEPTEVTYIEYLPRKKD